MSKMSMARIKHLKSSTTCMEAGLEGQEGLVKLSTAELRLSPDMSYGDWLCCSNDARSAVKYTLY